LNDLPWSSAVSWHDICRTASTLGSQNGRCDEASCVARTFRRSGRLEMANEQGERDADKSMVWRSCQRLTYLTRFRIILANINDGTCKVLPAVRLWIQLSATSATKFFWKDVRRREGTIGHSPLGFEIVARWQWLLILLRHRARRNRPESKPPGRMAEMLPCSETQACGCFSSSHRTCRQLLGDFELVAERQSAHSGMQSDLL
jgi:hypothetical protein